MIYFDLKLSINKPGGLKMRWKIIPCIIALLILIPFNLYSEIPLTPFPYDYQPIPTLVLTSGEPLRLNLSDYIPGMAPNLVTRISYPYQDRNIVVFQSPQNPLDIAIIYPETIQGYYIFPLLFEFKDETKSPFFIATDILPPEQAKKEEKPRPRILPYHKRTDKDKVINEYILYFFDPENQEEPDLENTKVVLGNERLISNLGIQDQSIFVPLPEGELGDKPLRIYAQSKKGRWAQECVFMEHLGTKDRSADWRDAFFYLVFGEITVENPRLKEKSSIQDGLTSYPLDKDDMTVLEQKIKNRYFEKLFVDVLFCPKQKPTPEWDKLIDAARKDSMNIIHYSAVSQSFYPMDHPEFKTDTLWNPLLTEKIHETFGSKTIGLTELHEAVIEFNREAVKKGAVPVLSLNVPEKPRLISLIPDTSTGNQKPESEYPLKYRYHEMALGYLATFSGIPILLYGDEIGLSGEGLTQWDQDLSKEQKALLKQVSQILEVRRKHKSLSRGVDLTLLSEQDILIFLKIDFEETIMCAFNRSNDSFSQEIRLPVPFNKIRKLKSLLKKGEGEIEKNKLRIKLPPLSFDCFSLEF